MTELIGCTFTQVKIGDGAVDWDCDLCLKVGGNKGQSLIYIHTYYLPTYTVQKDTMFLPRHYLLLTRGNYKLTTYRYTLN